MAYSSVLDKDIFEVLVNQEQIDEVTTRIAAEIDRDFKDSKRILLLCMRR